MHSLNLENIPDHLYAQIKRTAVKNRSSLAEAAMQCIEEGLRTHHTPIEEAMARGGFGSKLVVNGNR